MRPTSIVNFERLYLGSIAISLLTTVISWNRSLESLREVPGLGSGVGLFVGLIAVSYAIYILLWYFIVRRASVVAKWFFIVLLAFGILGSIITYVEAVTLGTGNGSSVSVAELVGITVAISLESAAAWMLFRPGAKEWFASRGASPPYSDVFS